MDQIRNLQSPKGMRIVSLLDPWTPKRNAYIQETIDGLDALEAPLVVLLDPDTGIAPTSRSMKHVAIEEIRKIFEAIHRGDTLVVYQHRWRDRRWRELSKRKFCEAIRIPEDQVTTIYSDSVALDVLLLAAVKP